MKLVDRIRKEGVSLKTIHGWLIVAAILLSVLLIYSTFHSSATFRRLSEATDEYIDLQKAAYSLMDASDFLTEKAQRFAVSGDMDYVREYFEEAFTAQNREKAIARMTESADSGEALQQLQEAMNGSLKLMDREYYAMKLVIEARGYTDYPEALSGVELTPEHAALSPAEKKALAEDMVLGREYYLQKDLIRADMKESLEALEASTHGTQMRSASDLKLALNVMRVVIIIEAVGILIMIWLTARLGINPVLKAVDRIRDDSPIPVTGAHEFRYLARTYNQMYDAYKKSVAHLNYKASHDELTQVYNRAGYDLLLSSLDTETIFMLAIDVDNFKQINDTYGHETGDRVLQKVADSLRRNFRSDDYVCRIGGDEFVVLMVHARRENMPLIESKVRQINAELANAADGLPQVSISVGASHGQNAGDTRELFTQADQALYETKRNGGRNLSVYSGDSMK